VPLLDGRVAIVTGAGRGIGRAIALGFARQGARVVVNDRDPEPMVEVRDLIHASGGSAIAVHADVAEAPAVERVLRETLDAYGTLDVLVNNARAHLPSGELGPFATVTDDAWHAFMRLNLGNLFLCTSRAAKVMLRKRAGSIVNISSIGAIRAHRHMIAYDAYKGAMEAFTRAVAIDMAPWNVRVNALQPGSIAVEWAADLGEDELRKRGAAIPMRRMGTPEEVADCAVFLASDLSSYVTGQVFAVDGGLVAQARTPQSEQVEVATPET
jgi:NAD(P)-dependent dehydrogenase (short-subunit alcohol dehydrogenase family)